MARFYADFYAPWPNFGKKLNQQWRDLRRDTELLKPLVQAAEYTGSTNDIKEAVLAAWAFGDESLRNRTRINWSSQQAELQFQCNDGTEDVPIWSTLFYIECDPRRTVFKEDALFEKNITVVGTFYGGTGASGGGGSGLGSISVSDGSNTISSSTGKISVSGNHFYVDKDSTGGPKINLRNDTDEKSLTVPYPGRSEDITWWRTSRDIHIENIIVNLITDDAGFYPRVDWTVRYAPYRDQVGTEIITNGHSVGFYPARNEATITSFDQPNVPRNNYMWFETTGIGEGNGKEKEISLTMKFTSQNA